MSEITSNDPITNLNIKDLLYQEWSKVPGLFEVDTHIKPFYLEGDTYQQYFQIGWMNFNGIIVPLAMIIQNSSNLNIYFHNLYNRYDNETNNLVDHLRRSYQQSYSAFEKYLKGGTSRHTYMPGMKSLDQWLTDKLTFQTDNVLIMPTAFKTMTLSKTRLKKIYQKDSDIDWSKISHYKKQKKGVY